MAQGQRAAYGRPLPQPAVRDGLFTVGGETADTTSVQNVSTRHAPSVSSGLLSTYPKALGLLYVRVCRSICCALHCFVRHMVSPGYDQQSGSSCSAW